MFLFWCVYGLRCIFGSVALMFVSQCLHDPECVVFEWLTIVFFFHVCLYLLHTLLPYPIPWFILLPASLFSLATYSFLADFYPCIFSQVLISPFFSRPVLPQIRVKLPSAGFYVYFPPTTPSLFLLILFLEESNASRKSKSTPRRISDDTKGSKMAKNDKASKQT